MRLVTYRQDHTWRVGAVVGDVVVDVDTALARAGLSSVGEAATMRPLLRRHGRALRDVAEAVDAAADSGTDSVGSLEDLEIGPPVTDPEKVLCIGLNYRDHVAETGRSLPTFPDVFVKFASSLIGHQHPIRGRDITEQLDFEGELAIVIGHEARAVSAERALEVIAGVTILNDITARDLQYRGTQWTVGKAVDGSTPVGPALVTLDEIPDVQALKIGTRVNGVEMQRSTTGHMIFSAAEIISSLSRTISLAPGDIIATGTPEGIGAKRTPPVWLRSGDVVEVDLEGVGTLRNTVA